MVEELASKVYHKLSNEYSKYIENIKKLSKEEIINESYPITMKQELVEMFYDTVVFNKYQLMGLLEKENILEFLYDTYFAKDGGLNNLLEEKMDDNFYGLGNEYEEKLNEKIDSNENIELIEDISNALIDFDNYDFCIELKKEYKVEDFDNYDIFYILNINGGAKYLYNYFFDLVRNPQLKYLKEIAAINPKNYDNIEKIMLKLQDIDKEEKKKNKNAKNKEQEER